MGRRQHFSLYIITIALGGLFYFSLPLRAEASHGSHLVVSELQAGGATTEDEFIELYNPTGATVDISAWSIQYKSATGNTFQKKNFDPGTGVLAHGFFLIARSDYHGSTPADMIQGSFVMAASGGHIFLVSNQTLLTSATDSGIIDKVGYGTANAPESTAAPAPPANQSIERKPGGSEGNGTDTDNNANDFQLRTTPTPQNKASTLVPTISSPPSTDGSSSSSSSTPDTSSASNSSGSPATPFAVGDILINEFMPNPAEGTEWVELYNKTSSAIDLTGWKLKDGTDTTVKTLSGTIAASGYATFDLTTARLNNNGDRVSLNSSQGTTIDAVSYGDWNDGSVGDNAPAPTTSGQSVARKSNGVDTSNDISDFATTDSPTKNAPNIITVTQTVSVRSNVSLPQSAFTPKLQIVINEFVSDPEDGPEWVELYNAGNLSVDLEGWYLEDGSEAKTKLTGTIIPEHFKVFSDISGSLNNKGDIIRLKNDKGELLDRVTYGIWEDGTPSDNAPVAEDPNAIARVHDGQDSDRDNEDFAVTTKPTKGKANVIETKSPSPPPAGGSSPIKGEEEKTNSSPVLSPPLVGGAGGGGEHLSLSEFLPNPAGSDDEEWVELYYDGAEPFALKGLQLDDGEGGSKPYVFDTEMIAPYSFLLLPKSKTHLTLNNNADSVRLLNQAGGVIDSVEYEEVTEGASYAKNAEEDWVWTSKSTPGAVNEYVAPTPEDDPPAGEDDNGETEEVEISAVRALEKGTLVRISGIISVPPNLLGKNIFYLSGSGIQVYASQGTPPLTLGDRVVIEGKVSESRGEARITVSKKELIEKNGSGPAPTAHAMVEPLNENVEGWLVEVRGTLIDIARASLLLDTGDDEIQIVIKKTTGIATKDLVPGSTVTITGVVIPANDSYAIAPRFQNDITVLESATDDHNHSTPGVTSESSRGGSPSPTPYAKATTYTAIGTSGAILALRRRKQFTSRLRTGWDTLRNRGKKNSVV